MIDEIVDAAGMVQELPDRDRVIDVGIVGQPCVCGRFYSLTGDRSSTQVAAQVLPLLVPGLAPPFRLQNGILNPSEA